MTHVFRELIEREICHMLRNLTLFNRYVRLWNWVSVGGSARRKEIWVWFVEYHRWLNPTYGLLGVDVVNFKVKIAFVQWVVWHGA
jgi:hypothetical protein